MQFVRALPGTARHSDVAEGSRSVYRRCDLRGFPDHETQLRSAGRAVAVGGGAGAVNSFRVFDAAAKNLSNPPRVYTEVALQQLPGVIGFFKEDVPKAFNEVKDAKLLAEFRRANDAVMAALAKYDAFLERRRCRLPRAISALVRTITARNCCMKTWLTCRLTGCWRSDMKIYIAQSTTAAQTAAKIDRTTRRAKCLPSWRKIIRRSITCCRRFAMCSADCATI